MFLEQQITILE